MKKLRILLVDDEPHALNGLRGMLHKQRNEWEMTFVNSPNEALTALKNTIFDVVVYDKKILGTKGADLSNEVKKRNPSCIRIVLSGQSLYRDIVIKSAATTNIYLPKPCDAETLKSTLVRVLKLHDHRFDDKLKQLISTLHSMPSPPSMYTKVMEELQKPEASINVVGEIISQDIAMTAKILQLSNSAFFFRGCRHISSPSEAILFLGLDTIKALVLSVQIFSQFDHIKSRSLCIKGLWYHSLTVGSFAKRIATVESSEKELIDYAFVGGLLHDIGKLVLIANYTEKYKSVIETVSTENIPLFEAEREMFGATHAEVGAYLVRLWGLPDPIVEAIDFHHCPEKSQIKEFNSLTAVHVANVRQYETLQTNGENAISQVDTDYLAELGLSERLPVWRKICHEAAQERE